MDDAGRTCNRRRFFSAPSETSCIGHLSPLMLRALPALAFRSMFSNIPFDKVNWTTSSFLIGTLFLTVTAVPVYIWQFGLDPFQIGLFVAMFAA